MGSGALLLASIVLDEKETLVPGFDPWTTSSSAEYSNHLITFRIPGVFTVRT